MEPRTPTYSSLTREEACQCKLPAAASSMKSIKQANSQKPCMPRHRKPTLASSHFSLSLSDNKLHQFGTALPISFSSAIAAMSLASHVHVSKLVDAPIPSQLISRPPWHAPASGITAVLRGWPAGHQ